MLVRRGMQRKSWGGEVERTGNGAGLVPWRGKGRSGTGVSAWRLSEIVEIEYRQPNGFGSRRCSLAEVNTTLLKQYRSQAG